MVKKIGSFRPRSRVRGFENILDRIYNQNLPTSHQNSSYHETNSSPPQASLVGSEVSLSTISSIPSRSSSESSISMLSQSSTCVSTDSPLSSQEFVQFQLENQSDLVNLAEKRDDAYGFSLVISQVFSQCNLNEVTQQRIYELMRTALRVGKSLPNYRQFKNVLNSLTTITSYKFLYCFMQQRIVDFPSRSTCCAGVHGSLMVFNFYDSVVNIINNNYKYFASHHQGEIDFTRTRLYREIWQNLGDELPPNTVRLTLLVNVDDAQMIKSSKTCTTPVPFTVAEIPSSQRISKKNIFNLGIYHGEKSCPVDVLWEKVLIEQFLALGILERNPDIVYSNNPLAVETKFGRIEVLVRIGCVIMDSVAKAKNLNIKSFMGYHGCPYCLIDGTRLFNEETRSAVFVYPYESDSFYPMKTKQFYCRAGTLAENNGEPYLGVKGKTCLVHLLPVPDGIPIDYMHNILEGVFKFLISLHPFKTKRVTQVLDNEVSNVKLPHDFTRKFRKISEISYWKASECRTFLFYLIPLLRDIVADDFFMLLVCLTTITRIFSTAKSKMSSEKFNEGKILIDYFLSSFQNIYGAEKMRFNLHLLCHIPDQYAKIGSLIDVSAFAFENNVFRLKRSFHGTRGHLDQMSLRYLIEKGTENYQDDLNQWLTRFDPDGKLSKQSKSSNGIAFEPLGIEVDFTMDPSLLRRISADNLASTIKFYEKFRINSIVYHSVNYKFSRQSCSRVISYKINQTRQGFGQILCFFTAISHENNPRCFAIIQEFNENKRPHFVKNLKPDQQLLKRACLLESCNDIFHLLDLKDRISFISCSKIKCKLILVPSHRYPGKFWASEIDVQSDHD